MSDEKSIDDLVDEWHDGNDPRELHEYLGMTEQEYADWVERKPRSIKIRKIKDDGRRTDHNPNPTLLLLWESR